MANVKGRIKTNPLKTRRAMAREMNVLKKTTRRVVHDHLGTKSRTKERRFLLTQRLKALKLQKMPIILFSDERYFIVIQIHNSMTNRFISTLKNRIVSDDIKSISQTKHPSQVMLFGLLAFNGLKMTPVFLLSGFRMGAREYLDEVLCPHVLPWVQANFGDDQNYVLMKHEAPCHTANLVQNWLRENINFWNKDLNPLDISIWAQVQAGACYKQHPNLNDLCRSIRKS